MDFTIPSTKGGVSLQQHTTPAQLLPSGAGAAAATPPLPPSATGAAPSILSLCVLWLWLSGGVKREGSGPFLHWSTHDDSAPSLHGTAPSPSFQPTPHTHARARTNDITPHTRTSRQPWLLAPAAACLLAVMSVVHRKRGRGFVVSHLESRPSCAKPKGPCSRRFHGGLDRQPCHQSID